MDIKRLNNMMSDQKRAQHRLYQNYTGTLFFFFSRSASSLFCTRPLTPENHRFFPYYLILWRFHLSNTENHRFFPSTFFIGFPQGMVLMKLILLPSNIIDFATCCEIEFRFWGSCSFFSAKSILRKLFLLFMDWFCYLLWNRIPILLLISFFSVVTLRDRIPQHWNWFCYLLYKWKSIFTCVCMLKSNKYGCYFFSATEFICWNLIICLCVCLLLSQFIIT